MLPCCRAAALTARRTSALHCSVRHQSSSAPAPRPSSSLAADELVLPPPPPPPPSAPSTNEASSIKPVAGVRKPVGGFTGGLIGFLLALALSGAYGYTKLLTDYQKANVALQSSVDDLTSSTHRISNQLARIENLEKEIEQLKRTASDKQQVQDSRNEYRKLINAHQIDIVELKARLWALEQDLQNLSSRTTADKTIRI